MTSVNSEYIFRKVQLVPETCIPDIYPLYTHHIPIVYLIYYPLYTHHIPKLINSGLNGPEAHFSSINYMVSDVSGPSTETSFRIHKGIGIEVESSFHLQLWSFIKIFKLNKIIFMAIIKWCSRKYSREFMAFQLHLRLGAIFFFGKVHIGTSWLNALQ